MAVQCTRCGTWAEVYPGQATGCSYCGAAVYAPAVAAPQVIVVQQRGSPKDAGVAYLLWFFLGLVGAHRFYLGRPGSGVLMWLTAGGCGIWWIVDAFLIPQMVREENGR